MRDGIGPGRYRYLLIALLGIVWIIIYLQRTNIGMLLVDTRFLAEMKLLDQTARQGLLMTVFLLVYSLTNMLSVPISNRLGPRRALLLGIVIGSMAMLAGGWAASFVSILMVRMLLGIGHGIQFPNLSMLVKNWFPSQERGRANAIYAVGGCLGPVLALPLYSRLNTGLGWEFSFFVPGILGLLCIIPLWLRWLSDHPSDNPYISAEEREYIIVQNIETPIKADATGDQYNISQLLINPSFGLLCVAYTAFLCSWWGLLTWMPQYLVQGRALAVDGMANQVALAYLVGVVGILAGGSLVDSIKRKSSVGIIALCGVALATLGIAVIPSPTGAIIFIALAVGINEFVYPTVWAILQSILPARLIVTGSGMMSGVSNLFSATTPFIMGFLIQLSGSYAGGLIFLVSMAILGALSCWLLYRQGH